MGLETVIVAFFAVGTILIVAGALTMGTSNLVETSYNGYTAISQSTMERLHTNIEVSSITFDGDNHVHLTVYNTGETKLENFDLWDIVVINSAGASYFTNNVGYEITYNEGLLNPGLLDPHESIEIEISTPFDPGENLLVKVNTDNGIVSSKEYTV